MPPHTSHLLQLLDVGCFSPLKTGYGHEVAELARQGVYYIDKLEFLWIYPRIRLSVLSDQNIKGGFLATGLILFSPERVLESLTIVRTPSLPGITADGSEAWTAKTLRTIEQLEQQARLMRDLLHASLRVLQVLHLASLSKVVNLLCNQQLY
jgi:hypothetical protein